MTLKVVYSFGHSHSGTETLWRLFPISWDWNAELKKPSPGPLQKRIKNVTIQSLAKQAYKALSHITKLFLQKENNKPRHGIRTGMTAVPLDAHNSNVVNHSRYSLAENCPELQGLEVAKMYTLALHKAPSTIFGDVLMTKIPWPTIRLDTIKPLCGSLSLISAKRLVVRPGDKLKNNRLNLFFFK